MKKFWFAIIILLILFASSFNYQKAMAVSYMIEQQYGDVLGQSKEKKTTKSPGQAKKADVGSVQEIKGNKVTIDNAKDKKKYEVTIDSDVKVIGKDKKQVKVKDIKIKDKMALIATDSSEMSTSSGKVKKVQKIYIKSASDSAQMKRQAVHGVIKSISGVTLTISHQVQQDRIYSVVTLPSTVISTKASKTAAFSDLKVGDRIVAVGDSDSKGAVIARRIHVIPGKATGVMSKQRYATPSSQLSNTPIATPSVTLRTSPTATPTASVSVTATPTSDITPSPTGISE